MALIVACLVVGTATGWLAGLLGIGGGLLMVPALMLCFSLAGLPAQLVPPAALGTSLAAVCVTGLVASREQLRLGQLACPFSARMLGLAACLVLGMLLGARLTTQLPAVRLLALIALYQLVIGAWIWRRAGPPGERPPPADGGTRPAQDRLPRGSSHAFFLLAGAMCAASGGGGADLLMPYFLARGVEPRRGTALCSYFGAVIGAAGFVGYGVLARPAGALPWSLGYVHLPALGCLALGTTLLVRQGARLGQRLSRPALARAFATFLMVSGIRQAGALYGWMP